LPPRISMVQAARFLPAEAIRPCRRQVGTLADLAARVDENGRAVPAAHRRNNRATILNAPPRGWLCRRLGAQSAALCSRRITLSSGPLARYPCLEQLAIRG